MNKSHLKNWLAGGVLLGAGLWLLPAQAIRILKVAVNNVTNAGCMNEDPNNQLYYAEAWGYDAFNIFKVCEVSFQIGSLGTAARCPSVNGQEPGFQRALIVVRDSQRRFKAHKGVPGGRVAFTSSSTASMQQAPTAGCSDPQQVQVTITTTGAEIGATPAPK